MGIDFMGIDAIFLADDLLFSREVKGRWEQLKASALNKTRDLIREPIETNFATKGETPLHIAVAYDDLKFLRSLIRKTKTIHGATKWVEEALGTRNENGNTPLHLAASMGNVGMCECIAEVNRSLLRIRNNAGETPLFSAALQGKKEAFLSCTTSSPLTVAKVHFLMVIGGRLTATPYYIVQLLGSTSIIHLYEDLVWYVNERGETPLHNLASKPSAFKSGSSVLGWKRIIYNSLRVEELKPNDSVQQSRTSQIQGNDRKAGFNFIGLPINFLRQVVNFFKKQVEADAEFDTENPTSKQVGYRKGNPVYKATETLFRIFGTTANIREEKEKHVWACQIMNILFSSENTYEQNSGACPLQKSDFDNYEKDSNVPNIPEDDHTIFSGKRTIQVTNERPFFVAARHGITEMVQKILESDSMAADYVNQDRKNILLLAIENRLTDVLEIVIKKYSQRPSGFMAVDDKGNSALHLAAILPENNPWPVPGATLQMQWEIKWFMFIKNFFSYYSFLRYNNEGKTPEELFAETHKELVKNSIMWLTNTSEACSVVAGLFVTIAFTTSITVPGGTRQDETGQPYLESQSAFKLFAVSSQVAFYSSLFSVVVFLAILTSGYHMSDFDKALPRKILLGLTALYVSIASTLTSFCSAHYFVLKAKLKHAASPVYIATCLVVTLFAKAQFPLYFELVWATFKKVPQRKSRRKIPEYLIF